MKECFYIVAMMFLFLLTGRWTEFGIIYKWLITGKLTIKEAEVEIVSEKEFWDGIHTPNDRA